jgi:hypothetical protein
MLICCYGTFSSGNTGHGGMVYVEKESDFKPTLVSKEVLAKYGLLVDEVPTRYHTPYFAHVGAEGISRILCVYPVKKL